jgi:hypothetical protein
MPGVQPQRIVACYAPSEALAPRARAALAGLGYRVVAAATQGRFSDGTWHADARIADVRHLSRLPEGPNPTPIIGLTPHPDQPVDDERVVGLLRPPASATALYALLQRALEPTPRLAPRAPARLMAECTRLGRSWTAELLSLSERGCLVRSVCDLRLEDDVEVKFRLPLGGWITARARVRAKAGEHAGLAFRDPGPPSRKAIADYVERRLATL